MANLIGTTTTHNNVDNNVGSGQYGLYNSTNKNILLPRGDGTDLNAGGFETYANFNNVSFLYNDTSLHPQGSIYCRNYYTDSYIKVGNEVLRIEYISWANESDLDSNGCIIDYSEVVHGRIRVERGALGTTATAHSPGETVEFWDGEVPGESLPDIPPEESEEFRFEDFELGNFENQMGVVKQLFFNKPNIGNLSQYNFNNTNNINYLNSNGLPQPYDKFQDKDLFTTVVGSKINEDIIEKNLKFAGNPSIKIENIYVANAGVDGTVKNNKVKIYMFSEAAYGGDPTQDGYSTVKSKMNDNSDDWKIYDEGFGNQSQGTDIGNLDKVEGVDIVSNFDSDSAQISIGDMPGSNLSVANIGNSLKLSTLPDVPNLITSVFNQQTFNPIYIVVLTTGDKKVAWPIKTDSRKKKYSIYKISNEDLFIKTGDFFTGTNYLVNFSSPTKTRQGEGGGGAQKSAWTITSLQIRINTLPGVKNDFSEASNYQNSISQVLPAVTINKEIFNSVEWLSLLNPKNQLDNKQLVEYRDVANIHSGINRHIDFFPFTTLGYSQINNQLSLASVDLQSYYNDLNDIIRSSAPLNVTFKFDIKNLDGTDLPEVEPNANREYYYFVIDWDDKDNKFQTLDDWLESKPENQFDYLELQNQNLYEVFSTTDSTSPNNVYTTPGIKNLKVIMFSIFNGVGNDDSPDFEVGRWKLITSRFYLDISPNKYPDFSNVGGADYTTIPWPYTTPVIGGVSQDSKYKKSIQNTLSGGKIGEFDFIDERFLINDKDNDELGKSIKLMDLEQCRYFNKPYDMYELLNLDGIAIWSYSVNQSAEYLATLPFPKYFVEMDWDGDGILTPFEGSTNSDAGSWMSAPATDPYNGTTMRRPDVYVFINWYNSKVTNPENTSYDNIETFPLNSAGYTYPDELSSWPLPDEFFNENPTDAQPKQSYANPSQIVGGMNAYNDNEYWDGETIETTFPMESSVGQIFIIDNQDKDLVQSCKLELNMAQITDNTLLDTSGNSNKGMLIGDYKIKKNSKGDPMRRDSFIKVPKKTGNSKGAL